MTLQRDTVQGELRQRLAWEPLRLTEVGRLSDVLAQGGGKLSTSAGDTGEPSRKPPGQG